MVFVVAASATTAAQAAHVNRPSFKFNRRCERAIVSSPLIKTAGFHEIAPLFLEMEGC